MTLPRVVTYDPEFVDLVDLHHIPVLVCFSTINLT